MAYPRLFEPFRIGNLTLKNRIAMAPMETHLGEPDGGVNEAIIAYYRERARGGAGLVITEFTCVDGETGFSSNVPQLRLDNDRFKAGHARLVAAIHAAGAKAVIQISHAGRQTKESVIGRQPVSSSPIPLNSIYMNAVPRPLEDAEIRHIIARYANTARLAMLAGYDGVMLHGAHGYLIQQFLSPLMNHRDDEWGGDFERRLRFPTEVIKAVKAQIGDKPLLYRMSVVDGVDGGITIEDSETIAPRLCEAGVDAIDISWGFLESAHLILEPMSVEEGDRLPYARRIRQATGRPVITAGVMRWPDKCEQAVIDGDTDIVSLGRALLADPMWPIKAQRGMADDIRPCTSCNWCIRELAQSRSVACAENPRCGKETEAELDRFADGRRAVVVGGGPGGMAAALLLDQVGFAVTLYEKRERLGGNLITSAVPPGKDKLFWYHKFLLGRIDRSRVEVRTGTPATRHAIEAERPDVVILANGSRLAPLDLSAWGNLPTAPAYEVLMGESDVPPSTPERPIVIYGGGETGTETAEFLAQNGHHVLLVTRSDAKFLARNAEVLYRIALLQRLQANPAIRILDHTKLHAVDGEHVALSSKGSLTEQPAAALLLAHGLVPDGELPDALASLDIPMIRIGDAAQVARIGEAVRDAYRAVQDLRRLILQPEPIAC
ncbi:2,4-dienoyl-CoA reductase (NADPH) [Sphingobium chlorophenolicum L-1]|uniref:2,4-dienoyl-CoA reductase (NADPH) n=1 Tax=Sphingobium chlorophenolicum L-1 TaxID=690566 RepID=F6F3Y2_SPHCR|nr:FAD-dependent oxidoreductase [Sphingobium chlorophenolicum]AEG51144.1 2,4-dienoyl-CoA reductase (NADPH) [Sphingobium chlorophenolicum L-1]